MGVFAALAALAACLGLQRRREARKEDYGTASYYSYTDTSASEYFPMHPTSFGDKANSFKR